MATLKLKRMPRMPGAKRRKLPDMTGKAPRIAEREPDALQELIRNLGGRSADVKLAKRVLGMKPEFPAASIPELIVYCWLTDQKIQFSYQAMLFGGRRAKGGLVPDFVVQAGGMGLAWQVQGKYWHRHESAHGQKDSGAEARMLGQVYKGVRISAVVDLWEPKIYNQRPRIFQLALNGIGMGE
jgi:hypothetical protein